MNWDGFEAKNCVVDGLWTNTSYTSHVENIASAGFNVIRLPFAGTCMQEGVYPLETGINFEANPDLKVLTNPMALFFAMQHSDLTAFTMAELNNI